MYTIMIFGSSQKHIQFQQTNTTNSIMFVPCAKFNASLIYRGSSIKDVRTNLGIFGPPPPPLVQACPHLFDHPLPLPLPLSVRTQDWHYLKHCNL